MHAMLLQVAGRILQKKSCRADLLVTNVMDIRKQDACIFQRTLLLWKAESCDKQQRPIVWVTFAHEISFSCQAITHCLPKGLVLFQNAFTAMISHFYRTSLGNTTNLQSQWFWWRDAYGHKPLVKEKTMTRFIATLICPPVVILIWIKPNPNPRCISHFKS